MRKIQLYKREGNARWGIDVPLECWSLVDDKDYDRILEFSSIWRLHSAGYAACTWRYEGQNFTILMHRLILGLDDSDVHTDHIDHDRLNNQRSNLRACSQAENNANLPYIGVGRHGKKWRAWTKRPTRHLGVFNTKEEAEAARDLWTNHGIINVDHRLLPASEISPCCGDTVVRNGMDHLGKQRYRCNSCRKTYRSER
jgi:hypothetical protein